MYQVIIANNVFSFIDGDYFENLIDSINFINNKLIEYRDDDYKRIENIFIKTNINVELRRMSGFQEIISYDQENSYIVLSRYNRKKKRWDKFGRNYSAINYINYQIYNENYFYLPAGMILKNNLDSINSFKDPKILKEYIIELLIYNMVDPKSIYDKILLYRNRTTLESVIKTCYDTILASEGLITI